MRPPLLGRFFVCLRLIKPLRLPYTEMKEDQSILVDF